MNKKDVMEMFYKIQKECSDKGACSKCTWYSENEGECMFFEDPSEWNVPEITERSVETL